MGYNRVPSSPSGGVPQQSRDTVISFTSPQSQASLSTTVTGTSPGSSPVREAPADTIIEIGTPVSAELSFLYDLAHHVTAQPSVSGQEADAAALRQQYFDFLKTHNPELYTLLKKTAKDVYPDPKVEVSLQQSVKDFLVRNKASAVGLLLIAVPEILQYLFPAFSSVPVFWLAWLFSLNSTTINVTLTAKIIGTTLGETVLGGINATKKFNRALQEKGLKEACSEAYFEHLWPQEWTSAHLTRVRTKYEGSSCFYLQLQMLRNMLNPVLRIGATGGAIGATLLLSQLFYKATALAVEKAPFTLFSPEVATIINRYYLFALNSLLYSIDLTKAARGLFTDAGERGAALKVEGTLSKIDKLKCREEMGEYQRCVDQWLERETEAYAQKRKTLQDAIQSLLEKDDLSGFGKEVNALLETHKKICVFNQAQMLALIEEKIDAQFLDETSRGELKQSAANIVEQQADFLNAQSSVYQERQTQALYAEILAQPHIAARTRSYGAWIMKGGISGSFALFSSFVFASSLVPLVLDSMDDDGLVSSLLKGMNADDPTVAFGVMLLSVGCFGVINAKKAGDHFFYDIWVRAWNDAKSLLPAEQQNDTKKIAVRATVNILGNVILPMFPAIFSCMTAVFESSAGSGGKVPENWVQKMLDGLGGTCLQASSAVNAILVNSSIFQDVAYNFAASCFGPPKEAVAIEVKDAAEDNSSPRTSCCILPWTHQGERAALLAPAAKEEGYGSIN